MSKKNPDSKEVLAEMDQWLIDLNGSKARMFYKQDAIRWRSALAALEAERALDAEIIIEQGAKLEAMEQVRKATYGVYQDWRSYDKLEDLAASWPNMVLLRTALVVAQQEGR